MKGVTTLWAVQTNLGNEATHLAIQTTCERHGFRFQGLTVVPFSDELPSISHDGPVLFYGATQWIRKIAASRRWSPGAFFDESQFTVGKCLSSWGHHMLNHDGVIVPIGSVATLPYADEDEIFVRPNGDFKEFAGEVLSFAKLCAWADVLRAGGLELDGSLLVAVSRPKRLQSEWRVFAVGGPKIVEASLYRMNGRLAVQGGAPSEVIAFAEARLREWMPVPALALDIAEHDGDLKIVELSDIHSCGHYAANVETIVVELSRVAERHYVQI